MSYLEDPPKASMLYALKFLPRREYLLRSMYRAYDCLPDKLQQRIVSFDLKHDATYAAATSAGR
jgi:alpha-ketoglutarate-dependent taurine dioxygenase